MTNPSWISDFTNGTLLNGTFTNGTLFTGISKFQCPHVPFTIAEFISSDPFLLARTIIFQLILVFGPPILTYVFGYVNARTQMVKKLDGQSDVQMMSMVRQWSRDMQRRS